MKIVSRSMITGVIAALAATACRDSVTNPTAAVKTPTVTSVSVTPSTATLRVGQTVTLVADVTADSGASRTVTWKSEDVSRATVNAAGLVTGVSAGPVVITAIATADTTKRQHAAITVQAFSEPTISIASVTSNNVPVSLLGVTGQIDVTFNIDRGDRDLSKLELVVNNGTKDTVVASQSLAPVSAQLAADASLTAIPVTLSLNTAAFTASTGAVAFKNGAYAIRGRLTTTNNSAMNSSSVNLTLANIDQLLGSVTTTASAGKNATATDAAGLVWNSGAVKVGVTPVIYSNTTIASATVTMPTGSVTLTTLPGTATFADTSAAPGVGGYTSASVTPTIATITSLGQAGPSVFTNAAALNLRIDNTAPTAPSYAFNTQGTANNWVGKSFKFNTASGNGYTAGTESGVGKVTTTFEVTAAPATASSTWTVVTTGNDLQESQVNTAYALRITDKDALGNAVKTVIGGTFGVDKTAPTVAWDVTAAADKAQYTALSPAANYVITATDGNSGLSGTPAMVTVTRQAKNLTGAGTCIIGTYDATAGCKPAAMGTVTAVDGGAAAAGYYTYTATVSDRAGNVSGTTLSRSVVIDDVAPSFGGISIPQALVGGQSVSFSTTVTDNLDLNSSAFAMNYPAGLVRYAGPSLGTAFSGSLVTSATPTFTVPSFIRSIEMTNGSNLVVDDRANAKPTSVSLRAADAAGNVGSTSVAIPASNIAGTYTYSSTALVNFAVTNTDTLVSNPQGAAAAVNATSIVFTAKGTAPSNSMADPFTAVRFYYLTGGEWVLLGTATPSMTDDGTTRTFTYTYNWTPAKANGVGAISVRAMGVNANGDALMTRTNSHVVLTTP